MNLKDGYILIPSSDHSYSVVRMVKKKAVYNYKSRSYAEFVGDDYLEDGDIVVDALVAE